jgi:hypothetical protein
MASSCVGLWQDVVWLHELIAALHAARMQLWSRHAQQMSIREAGTGVQHVRSYYNHGHVNMHVLRAIARGNRHAAAPSAERLALGVLRSACPLSREPRGDDGADI